MWRYALAVGLVAVACAIPGTARARIVHYVLTGESRLWVDGSTVPEALGGSFDATDMPMPTVYAVDAVTGLRLRSANHEVAGAGFLQRLGADRVSLVIEGRYDGAPILLVSKRQQAGRAGEISLELASQDGAETSIRVTLVAVPFQGEDSDADGIPDKADNCPRSADVTQADADGDGVGDACDGCTATPEGSAVAADGCSIEQRCPCEGPGPGEEWPTQREYVQCVARELKAWRQAGHMDKAEIRRLLQDAVQSGCGRRVLAGI